MQNMLILYTNICNLTYKFDVEGIIYPYTKCY